MLNQAQWDILTVSWLIGKLDYNQKGFSLYLQELLVPKQ
jgi:hypothetical protein